ncbi:MurR/RpiR family transcriptional regulator [Leekyejoonella antrihumi]|uniref:MurR/RpiR family transcriptional regulator n=1 Tax=Leekyejoonella antrihumi TaxID=1660198 RepID=A0A563DVB4_9MICO|nr:MurR/RpiR family transcriptional regulator [Leekyejoonella antrihumi]TWP33911.1 MurR/RpiR family transcriptional regulator [Leekyejoonella antrihumi]
MNVGNSSAVSARIHELMDDLSEAERRVARGLLSDYPASGLGTSHSLAEAVGVSAPTVVRFAIHLGFDGFSDMQRQLRTEVSASASSPVLRTLAQSSKRKPSTPFSASMQRREEAIRATLQLTPCSELTSATVLIADSPRQVLVTGGFFSSSVARIMALQLSQVRSNVLFVEEPLRHDAGSILDAKKRSVLIMFDLRRYEQSALELAKQAKGRGIDVILITDRWMSPVASVADVVLPVDVEAVPFDTFVALLALVESIVESVMARCGPKGLRRMKDWEAQAVGHTRPWDAGPSTPASPSPNH